MSDVKQHIYPLRHTPAEFSELRCSLERAQKGKVLQVKRAELTADAGLACFIRERSLVQGYVTISLLWS